MAEYSTADEARQQCIAKMGEELGGLYSALWQEVVTLHVSWFEYEILFGTKPSRVAILNKAAPLFFAIIQKTSLEAIVLGIARLTDPPKFAGRANLTIQRLTDLVRSDLKQEISEHVEAAIQASSFCRDWRNRRLAHRDLGLSLGDTATPLRGATREEVGTALTGLAIILNGISGYYLQSTTSFERDESSRGALSLVYVLDNGLAVRAARLDRMRRGEASEEEYKPRDL